MVFHSEVAVKLFTLWLLPPAAAPSRLLWCHSLYLILKCSFRIRCLDSPRLSPPNPTLATQSGLLLSMVVENAGLVTTYMGGSYPASIMLSAMLSLVSLTLDMR